ncbi:MAG TPA: undecaprenyl-diphosphatase UppP [Anaerolineales bacterium]|nr:undecaprenyl-diphosphatase UppP [Anaerolineales bacterium]
MTLFQSLLLGIIQGLTEFIPVSSTAHLLIAQHLFGIPADDFAFAFSVLVQLGTLLALIIYFWRDLLTLVRAFFARPFSTPENRLAWYIIIATVPALVAGFVLRHVIEALFKTPLVEACIRLFATAILLSLAEFFGKKLRHIEAMNWVDALVIGLFQILSVFPGASRSGSTISGGMLRGLDRPAAARFAFLLAVPVMLAAGGYETLSVLKMPGLGSFLPLVAVGFIAAAVVGWLAIRWLLGYLNRHSLHAFAIYCAIAGLVALGLQVL